MPKCVLYSALDVSAISFHIGLALFGATIVTVVSSQIPPTVIVVFVVSG